MKNPLSYYKAGHRPLGIWIGGVFLVMQMLMQLYSVFVAQRLPIRTLIVSAPLFLIAFGYLLKRRHIGMVLSVSYFIAAMYAPMFVISHLPFKSWWCVLIWWSMSIAGIFSLYFNRRWFDEELIRFGYYD